MPDEPITPAEELEALKDALARAEGDAYPVVEKIKDHTKSARRAMSRDPVDTLTLSNEAVELAILNQQIGQRVSDAGYLNRWAKEFYERMRENIKVKLVNEEKLGVGLADSMKVEKAHDYFNIYNDCERHYDVLIHIRRATDKTIDTIRTKISFEKSDQRNA